jgi:tetratricopeptide (TPR) repeat protein
MEGASESAEARMDFGRASYTNLYEYPDTFVFTVVNSFARRQGDHEPMEGFLSAEHGRMGDCWFSELIREYPADIFSRGVASVLMLPKISALSFQELERTPVPNQASIARFSPFQKPLAEHFAAWGLWYMIAGLVLFAFYDLRAAAGAGLLVLYFAALPGLLFELRHCFPLAFAPYWIAAAMAAWAGRVLWRVVRQKRPFLEGTTGQTMPRRIAGALLLPLALALGLVLIQTVLRQVQAVTMARVLSQYGQARLEPLPVREEKRDKNMLLCPDAALPGLAPIETLAPFETCGEYLVLDMDYDGLPTRLRTVYDCPNDVDFTQGIQPHIDYPGQPCRIRFFFPVYLTTWPKGSDVERGRFAGIEVEKARRGLIHGLYRVANADEFALWPYMTVPEQRETFVDHKSGPHDRVPAILAVHLLSLFSTDSQARIAAEIALAKSDPGYVPRLTDAMSTEDETYERWKQAVREIPELSWRAVADLKRFFPPPSASDPAAEIRLQLRVAELMPGDCFAPTRAAWLQASLGDPAGAAERAKAVLMKVPDYAFAASTLSEAFAGMNQPEKRLAAWHELHGAWPGAVLPAVYLALTRWDMGDTVGGQQVLDCVTPEADIDPEVLLDFGRALATCGRTEQGITQIDRAVAASAPLAERAANACAEAAGARAKAGDNAAAITLYSKARALSPVNPTFSMHLAELREAEGDFPGALAEYRSVLSGTPESPQSAERMDVLFEHLNDREGRLQDWRAIAADHPGAAIPQLHLGLALETAGDVAGARAAYGRALKIDPKLAGAHTALDRVNGDMTSKGRP